MANTLRRTVDGQAFVEGLPRFLCRLTKDIGLAPIAARGAPNTGTSARSQRRSKRLEWDQGARIGARGEMAVPNICYIFSGAEGVSMSIDLSSRIGKNVLRLMFWQRGLRKFFQKPSERR